MPASAYPSASVEGWQELDDPVRGRRLLRRNAAGLPEEIHLADGRKLHLSHDRQGRLTGLAGDDGYRLALRFPGRRHRALIVSDQAGDTRVRVNDRGQRIRRGDSVLTLECDGKGRPRRMRLPGSARALLYRWRKDSVEIGAAEDDEPVIRVTLSGRRQRYELDGASWEEQTRAKGLSVRALDEDNHELLAAEVFTDNQHRTSERRWNDGSADRYDRDSTGRLSTWRHVSLSGGGFDRTYGYREGELVEETIATAGRRATKRRTLDGGGRPVVVTSGDGEQTRYEYDAAGRRTRRTDRRGTTRYAYDILGKLGEVCLPDGRRVRLSYDGLGRRVRVDVGARTRFEHRDGRGRLWAVTDGAGRALHTFIWLGERVLARIDGPVGAPLAEAYLTDASGTPVGVLIWEGGHGHWRAEPVASPPYGSATIGFRPTLYGHFADPETGLIHFGGRDLDPELGLFLTPDPWHGGDDDPRRWGSYSKLELAAAAEYPARQVHAYALCRFDPLGAIDYNGYTAETAALGVLYGFTNVLLGPTWGMPLTSVSLFFFLPLAIYCDILGLAWLWAPAHSFFRGVRMPPFAGSVRQFIIVFALNGFVPGFFTSQFDLDAHRAFTAGMASWINRHELSMLGRHQALEVEDLSGQDAGHSGFNRDPNKRSIVAVEGRDDEGRIQVHASYWSRSFGSEVQVVGGNQVFRDRMAGGVRRGYIQLASAIPEDFPTAEDQDSDNELIVREYLFEHGVNHASDAELIELTGFVLKFDDNEVGLAKGDAIEVTAPGAAAPPTPAYFAVAKILEDDGFSQAVLYAPFPARFNGPPPINEDLVVSRLVPGRGHASPGWDAPQPNVLHKAGPFPDPPKLRKAGRVRATASAADPTVQHPLGEPVDSTANQQAHARIERIQTTIDFEPTAPTVAIGWKVYLISTADGPLDATMAAPAQPGKVHATGHDFEDDDFLSLKIKGAPDITYARVDSHSGDDLELEYLAPQLAWPVAGPVDLELQKLEDVSPDEDSGMVKTKPDDDTAGVEVERLAWLRAGSLVRFESPGGDSQIRKVLAVAEAEIGISENVVGPGPYEVQAMRLDPSLSDLSGVERSSLRRFLEWQSGDLPAAYGAYPNFLLNAQFAPAINININIKSAHLASRCYVQSADPKLHEDFRARWLPVKIGGKEGWLLEEDLPIGDGVSFMSGMTVWRVDPDAFEADVQILGGPPYRFEIREFRHHGVERPLGGGRKVTSHEPEVLVPRDPTIHDTHQDALIEHEIHHAVQSNIYGPILGALPLQGIFRIGVDAAEADWDWVRESEIDNNNQVSWPEVFSIGGLMQLSWKYVFLLPLYLSDDLRKEIVRRDFDFWNRIFNPFWGNLIAAFPEIQPRPDDPDFEPGFSDNFGVALVQSLARITDLRSWTPFIGFLPFIMPSDANSWLEQQASRASGDLYSSILSADDEFNYIVNWAIDSEAANLERPLGDLIRIMLFAHFRLDRLLRFDHADWSSSPLAYKDVGQHNVGEALTIGVVTVPADAAGNAQPTLVHTELYGVSPAGGTRFLLDPSGANRVEFAEAAAGDRLVPRPRTAVPVPPYVNRSAGIYFFAGGPGTYLLEIPVGGGGGTNIARITIGGVFKYGDDEVPWQAPVNQPVPAPAPPVLGGPRIKRWATEVDELSIEDRETGGYKVTIVNPVAAAGLVTKIAGPEAWTLKVDKNNRGGPHDVGVRMYRMLPKNDPAFDLEYDSDDVPTLKGVSSFLDKDLWIQIREFIVEVNELPALSNATVKSNDDHEFHTAIPLRVDDPVVIRSADASAPPFPEAERIGPDPNPPNLPRQQKWRVGPLNETIEDPIVYEVKVTFGPDGNTADHTFDLTVQPVIHLTHAAGPGPFQASEATDLLLDISDGQAPFDVEGENLPEGTLVRMDGGQVRVEVNQQPPTATECVVVVRDTKGLEGRRTIRIIL